MAPQTGHLLFVDVGRELHRIHVPTWRLTPGEVRYELRGGVLQLAFDGIDRCELDLDTGEVRPRFAAWPAALILWLWLQIALGAWLRGRLEPLGVVAWSGSLLCAAQLAGSLLC